MGTTDGATDAGCLSLPSTYDDQSGAVGIARTRLTEYHFDTRRLVLWPALGYQSSLAAIKILGCRGLLYLTMGLATD